MGSYSRRPAARGTWILAFGFWLWSAFIALGAGFVGALFAHASPATPYLGLGGWAAATAFVVLLLRDRRRTAAVALAASLALLSYPFFVGLTPSGRGNYAFGPVLALAALWNAARSRSGRTSGANRATTQLGDSAE